MLDVVAMVRLNGPPPISEEVSGDPDPAESSLLPLPAAPLAADSFSSSSSSILGGGGGVVVVDVVLVVNANVAVFVFRDCNKF